MPRALWFQAPIQVWFVSRDWPVFVLDYGSRPGGRRGVKASPPPTWGKNSDLENFFSGAPRRARPAPALRCGCQNCKQQILFQKTYSNKICLLQQREKFQSLLWNNKTGQTAHGLITKSNQILREPLQCIYTPSSPDHIIPQAVNISSCPVFDIYEAEYELGGNTLESTLFQTYSQIFTHKRTNPLLLHFDEIT